MQANGSGRQQREGLLALVAVGDRADASPDWQASKGCILSSRYMSGKLIEG